MSKRQIVIRQAEKPTPINISAIAKVIAEQIKKDGAKKNDSTKV